jgi:cell division GTPase FtsZ
VDAPRAVPGTVDGRVSACFGGGDGYGVVPVVAQLAKGLQR